MSEGDGYFAERRRSVWNPLDLSSILSASMAGEHQSLMPESCQGRERRVQSVEFMGVSAKGMAAL